MTQSILIRIVIQRTSSAEVIIHSHSQGKIDKGLFILFGVGFKKEINNLMKEEIYHQDENSLIKNIQFKLEKLADKILALRIFSDSEDKMNLSVRDVEGGLYVVSQFTLFANCSKGNRPNFTEALKPSLANKIYEKFVFILKEKSLHLTVLTGKFGEDMKVFLCNDGPVTLILEESI